jgi:hypothetical protein
MLAGQNPRIAMKIEESAMVINELINGVNRHESIVCLTTLDVISMFSNNECLPMILSKTVYKQNTQPRAEGLFCLFRLVSNFQKNSSNGWMNNYP